MATLDIANRYLAAAPVIVTSPTTRCGTTLVQRLLSASDNAFIYGEEIGNQARVLTSLFLNQIGHWETQGPASDQAFGRALDGDLDEWRPALAPPSEVMLKAWSETYYQLPMALAEFGRSIGRPIWGFKWPGAAPEMARGLMALMPKSKLIYVTRDLADALKSAKARRFVRTAQDVDGFCAQWARHMSAFAQLPDNGRIARVRYEGSRFEDDLNTLTLRAGATVDTRLDWQVSKDWGVFVAAENLSNTALETGQTADHVKSYDEPRVIRFGFKFRG